MRQLPLRHSRAHTIVLACNMTLRHTKKLAMVMVPKAKLDPGVGTIYVWIETE